MRIRLCTVIVVAALLAPQAARAQRGAIAPTVDPPAETATKLATSAETEPSPEEVLIFSDDELVSVATKRKVAIDEAPANVSVITHEQIVRSPSLSIPEILRRIAGMDVITVTAAESDASPRGFVSGIFGGDRIAVLIDGRLVNFEPIGGTLWNALPVSRYDIKRIEVIKGPMSSLYGDRALLGAVNIVTFDPDEARTTLAGGGGMYWAANGDFVNAGKFADGLWYKITGTYSRADEFDDVAGDGRDKDLENLGFTGMIDWKSSDNMTGARLTGGFSNADLALSIAGISHWNMRDGFVMGDVFHDFGAPGRTTFKSWWRRMSEKSSDVFGMGFSPASLDQVSAEVNHTVETQVADWFKNTAIVGVEYRLLTTGDFPAAQDIHNLAGFFQDELRFWDELLITLGFRYDYQKDFTGGNPSGHGSIVWLADPKYTLRASASIAFNTPTFFELFLDERNIPFSIFTANAMGNRNLGSEEILYFELANRIRPLPWLTIDADAFYYRIKDLITPELRVTTPTNLLLTFQNDGGIEAIGGELGLTAEAAEGLDVYANWSYQHFRPILGNLYTVANLGNPQNKVNAGLRYASKFRLFVNVDFSWVQSHEAQAGAIVNFPNTPAVELGNQFLLNARVGYQPIEKLELAIIANNILNDNTPQVPALDPTLNMRMAEYPHFRLLGTISYTF